MNSKLSASNGCDTTGPRDSSSSNGKENKQFHVSSANKDIKTLNESCAIAVISTANIPVDVRWTKTENNFPLKPMPMPPKSVGCSTPSDSLLTCYLGGHWPRQLSSDGMCSYGTVYKTLNTPETSMHKTSAGRDNLSSSLQSETVADSLTKKDVGRKERLGGAHLRNSNAFWKDLEFTVNSLVNLTLTTASQIDDLCNQEIDHIVQMQPLASVKCSVRSPDGHRAPVARLLDTLTTASVISGSPTCTLQFRRIGDDDDVDCDEDEVNRALDDVNHNGIDVIVLDDNGRNDGTTECCSLGDDCDVENNYVNEECSHINKANGLPSPVITVDRLDPEGCENLKSSFVERIIAKSVIPSPKSAFYRLGRHVQQQQGATDSE